MSNVVWVLFALPDESSDILESFEPPEEPPTQEYVEDMYGEGYLYEYDLNQDRQAVNGRPVPLK